MNYDFVEIGTGNFDTLIQQATENSVGISVEPIVEYLNQLPNPPGVKKFNCAITASGDDSFIKIFYIPEHVINEQNLAWWLKGCNSINDYHPLHVKFNLTKLVETKTVPSISIKRLFQIYNVETLEHLKLDTEGYDSDILMSFIEYLKTIPRDHYPKQITFESNHLTPISKIQEVVDNYVKIGYTVVHQDQDNTILKIIQ